MAPTTPQRKRKPITYSSRRKRGGFASGRGRGGRSLKGDHVVPQRSVYAPSADQDVMKALYQTVQKSAALATEGVGISLAQSGHKVSVVPQKATAYGYSSIGEGGQDTDAQVSYYRTINKRYLPDEKMRHRRKILCLISEFSLII